MWFFFNKYSVSVRCFGLYTHMSSTMYKVATILIDIIQNSQSRVSPVLRFHLKHLKRHRTGRKRVNVHNDFKNALAVSVYKRLCGRVSSCTEVEYGHLFNMKRRINSRIQIRTNIENPFYCRILAFTAFSGQMKL